MFSKDDSKEVSATPTPYIQETTTSEEKSILSAKLVSSDQIKVGYGQTLKVEDIKVTVVSDSKTKATFSDGVAEKKYTKLGEASDKLI